MRGRMARRAWRYEKKLDKEKGGVLARRCWEEIKERGRERGWSEWEEERKGFLRRGGTERDGGEKREGRV